MSEIEKLNNAEYNKDPESNQDSLNELPVDDPGLIIIDSDGEIDHYVSTISQLDDESSNWAESIFHLPTMDYSVEDPKKVWNQEAFDAFSSSDMPETFLMELIKNVNTQYVMGPQLNLISEEEMNQFKVDHPDIMHLMLISMIMTDAALGDPNFLVADELLESVAEVMAVAFDQLIVTGDGQGRMIGLVPYVDPNKIDTDNVVAISKRKAILDAVTVVELNKNQDQINGDDFVKVQQAYLDIFGLKPGTKEAQEKITKAHWYMNSNTALHAVPAKIQSGDYLIDQNDPILTAVGVPESILESPIVYNEWMEDLDYRRINFEIVDSKKEGNILISEDDVTYEITEVSRTCIIYGDIDDSYNLTMCRSISARHYEDTTPPGPWDLPDNKRHGIMIGIYIAGDVNFDHTVNGKLPYVVLQANFDAFTPDEINKHLNRFIRLENSRRSRRAALEEARS